MKPNCTIIQHGGLALIEVLFVILVVAVVAAVLFPWLQEARAKAARVQCANDLMQIGLSFKLWAGDHNEQFPMQVSVTNGGTMESVGKGIAYIHFRVMSNELASPVILTCPADRSRRPAPDFGPRFGNQNVSYSVGLDATPYSPQMLLSGDDNLVVGGAQARSGMLELWTNAPVAWTPRRHLNGANVTLGDGSVQGLTSQRLEEALSKTGITNRLAMP